jgi:hypothetical protein
MNWLLVAIGVLCLTPLAQAFIPRLTSRGLSVEVDTTEGNLVPLPPRLEVWS